MRIKAFIFDMDGVISDTQTVMAIVESDFLREHGIDISPDEVTRQYAGTTSREMLMHVFTHFKKPLDDLEGLIIERRKRIDEAVSGDIREVPGTRQFIEKLRARGLSLAVASASRLAFIRLVLAELGLSHYFGAFTSAEEVSRGKPEPDIFLLAAERLGVSPDSCVVIEDGIHGMTAAHRAGMKCIGLVRNKEHGVDYPADLLVSSLQDVDLENFLSK